ATAEVIFAKLYRPDGTWNSPWQSIGLQLESNSTVTFSVSVGGTLTFFSSPTSDALLVGTWNLIVAVYDGTTMSLYINGVLVASQAKTGAIDYGTHGPWSTGASPGATGTKNGILDEIRVANVARNAAWVEAYWKAGMLL